MSSSLSNTVKIKRNVVTFGVSQNMTEVKLEVKCRRNVGCLTVTGSELSAEILFSRELGFLLVEGGSGAA